MSPIKMLDEALSAGKDFGSLAGRLRDKFKSGTADLQAVLDEAESVVDSAVAKAKDGLAAFKSEVEKVEKEAGGEDVNDLSGKTYADLHPAEPADPVITTPTETTTIAVVPASADTTPVLTGAGSVTVDPGTTVHVDTGTGVTVTVPHDGTEPTATDATGSAVSVPPAALAETVAATSDAGVTVAAPAAPEAAPMI